MRQFSVNRSIRWGVLFIARNQIMRKIVRDRILEKHGNKCLYCGSTKNIQIDHIIPLSKGGRHNENNFQPLCQKCNLQKGNNFNADKFFRKGDGKSYISVNRELADYLPHLKSSEFYTIIEHYFKLYCGEND